MDSEDSSSGSESSETEERTPNLKRTKPQAAPKKKPKLLTAQELHELQDAESAQSFFGLQLEELLQETQAKTKHVKEFQSFLAEFEQAVAELPALEKKPKSKLDRVIGNNSYLKADKEIVMSFSKPDEKVQVFGLCKLDGVTKLGYVANINVTIPKACFNVKDYFDNRYFVRRHWYLIYLTQALKGHSLAWESFAGNWLLPILKVKLKSVLVKIHATPPEGYFYLGRALPSSKNLRLADDEMQYNSALGHDLTLSFNNKHIEAALHGLSNVAKAVRLIKIWLKQRELTDDLFEDIITYFFTYLVTNGTVTEHMNLAQALRNFWMFSKNITRSQGLYTKPKDETGLTNLNEFSSDYVFLDKTGHYNVLSMIAADKFAKFQSECEIALNLLDKHAFFPLFISKVHRELQFDMTAIVELETEGDDALAEKRILEVLKRGLNKRARLIVPYLAKQEWSWGSVPEQGETREVRFGISLDASGAFEFVERGPELHELKEAAEFRQFWGELAEDRRFKDGTFAVAVVFDAATIKSRREIVRKIVEFLLKDKCKLSSYRLVYDSTEEALVNKRISAPYPMGTNEEGCLVAIKASDELGKLLKSLDLPLPISTIRGISTVYSCTEVFPQVACRLHIKGKITNERDGAAEFNVKKPGFVPRYIEPIECLLQFEDSSKWIDSLKGIAYTKLDFFLIVQRLLQKQHITSKVTRDYLEVLYKGLVFRYRIFVQKEVGLLMKQVENNGAIKYKNTAESLSLKKRCDLVPKIISALGGVKDQFPCYGPSSALIKRWLRSHMVDTYLFPDIAIDLVNASLFLSEQSPFLPPLTPQIAFLRFLRFVVEFNWKSQAVIVNFNDNLSNEKIKDIEMNMVSESRQELPNLYIATPFDEDLWRSPFTKPAPSKEILMHTKRIAVETYEQILNGAPVDAIFKPAVERMGFDLVIQLRPLINPRRHEQLPEKPEDEGTIKLNEAKHKSEKSMPIVGHDPVQLYLADLRDHFSEQAVFFHDTYGGNAIGVLWTPKAGGQLDWLIEDFYHLGRDLVKTVDKK